MPSPTPFNLKQKLASLSLAQSSLSTPNGAEQRSPTKRKMFFNAPWKKQQSPTPHIDGQPGQSQIVQEVLSRMIFQAGVDYETRPMVVLNASALPDPELVSYDLLLIRILSYLNLYVEADYTVVFFAAGSRHTPSWNWVWKAYRSLSRKYRKNLKQLYVVHSSFFSRMLFSLAGAIISPKFFQKLMYITTLSELAQHVPLTQIDMPPAVYQENLKFEHKITLPVQTRSSTFGVPLEDLMGYSGEKGDIPRVVKDSIQFLRYNGMTEEGLFRRSPSSVLLRAAQDAYDRGNVVSLETFNDPHLPAVLLKKYLRDLPEPIFPEHLYPLIRRCPMPTDDPRDMLSVNYIRETILPEIPPCAYILLSQILHLLHDVSLRSASNRMDASNLAIVISPNLVRGSNPMRDVMMCSVPGSNPHFDSPVASKPGSPILNGAVEGRTTLGMVVILCIKRYYEIFDEVVDRSEAVKPWKALRNMSREGLSSVSSSASGSPQQPTYVLSNEDDDDLDDEALAMPVEGSDHPRNAHISGSPPSSWGTKPAPGNGVKRHKATLSSGTAGRSMDTVRAEDHPHGTQTQTPNGSGGGGILAFPTNGKAKSLISIEKNGISGPGGTRRGSITIGRGTTRKGSGVGVEALSITAEGFFSAPGDAPPVPAINVNVRDRAKRWEEGGS